MEASLEMAQEDDPTVKKLTVGDINLGVKGVALDDFLKIMEEAEGSIDLSISPSIEIRPIESKVRKAKRKKARLLAAAAQAKAKAAMETLGEMPFSEDEEEEGDGEEVEEEKLEAVEEVVEEIELDERETDRIESTSATTDERLISFSSPHSSEASQPSLTSKDLEDYVRRVLVPLDPVVNMDLVEYNYKLREYLPKLPRPGELLLLDIEGNIIHVDSPELEGLKPLIDNIHAPSSLDFNGADEVGHKALPGLYDYHYQKEPAESSDDVLTEISSEESLGEKKDTYSAEFAAFLESEEIEEGGEDDEERDSKQKDIVTTKVVKTTSGRAKKIKFITKGTGTSRIHTKDETTEALPPLIETAKFQLSQRTIQKYYEKDIQEKIALKEREERDRLSSRKSQLSTYMVENVPDQRLSQILADEQSQFHSGKILERVIVQNMFEDVTNDCQFYEDPADKYRNQEGVLLPLWEFFHKDCHMKTVTDITWSARYYDLFAVSFSQDDATGESHGIVCGYTLKNPSHPEYRIKFSSGAQTVDFHNEKSYYLATGLKNGKVAVTNIQNELNLFTIESEKKHNGSVVELRWKDDPRDRTLTMYSAGTDGKILKWLVDPQMINLIPVITLLLQEEPIRSPTGDLIHLVASCTCLAFEPEEFEIFCAGTAEGRVYKCNASYSCSYLFMYMAHESAVTKISYNTFDKEMMATSGDDGYVKIWMDCKPDPLFVLNLGSSVGDVQWSPYSSTVLAGASSDGRVHLYDLNVFPAKPVCSQIISYPETSLITRLRFNDLLPLVFVGDGLGHVTSYKVSPNCRIPAKEKKVGGKKVTNKAKLEKMKLEKVIRPHVRKPSNKLEDDDKSLK